jgi:hypothetical protein
MFVLPAMRDRAKRSMRRRGGERPRRGWVSAHSRPVSSPHDVFRAAHPVATRKEGTVHLFTGRTYGGASTGFWPAHIFKPSPLRSTALAGPAASNRTTSS